MDLTTCFIYLFVIVMYLVEWLSPELPPEKMMSTEYFFYIFCNHIESLSSFPHISGVWHC